MKTSQSTIFPGMELNKAVAFEDTEIQQIESNAQVYQAQNPDNIQKTGQDQSKQISHFIANVGMSFSDYMNYALYDTTFGFYSSGNVIFVKRKNKAAPSFLTYSFKKIQLL